MSDEADLHIYDHDPADAVPYRCPACDGIAWSRRRRPKCLGTAQHSHEPTPLVRIDTASAPSADACPGLVLR